LFKIKSLDIFFIFFVLAILSLGTWQILRLNSKKNLISQLEVNLKKNSISFNKDINKEYTKVKFKKNKSNPIIFLYKLKKGEIGFKVIVPYDIDNSSIVLVDKGWVRKKNINLMRNTSFSYDLIQGYTKKIIPVNFFTPKNNFTEDFVYSIDIEYLKKTLNKDIYPLLIIQTSPNNKDIISNDYEIHITNNHLQYALTWYGLALFTIIFFLYYKRRSQ
jgi:surfeit locus 1 family protein